MTTTRSEKKLTKEEKYQSGTCMAINSTHIKISHITRQKHYANELMTHVNHLICLHLHLCYQSILTESY
jgi:hypothetical protein